MSTEIQLLLNSGQIFAQASPDWRPVLEYNCTEFPVGVDGRVDEI
jgi:hypothetical protein